MRESRTSGSVRGGRGNPVPYRYNRTCRNNGLFRRVNSLAILALAQTWCRLRGRSCSSEQASLEKIQLCAAIHLSLHQLQLRVLPLGLAI